ncbi:hypothetical protein SPARM206S_04978 [Streptomyces parvulus]
MVGDLEHVDPCQRRCRRGARQLPLGRRLVVAEQQETQARRPHQEGDTGVVGSLGARGRHRPRARAGQRPHHLPGERSLVLGSAERAVTRSQVLGRSRSQREAAGRHGTAGRRRRRLSHPGPPPPRPRARAPASASRPPRRPPSRPVVRRPRSTHRGGAARLPRDKRAVRRGAAVTSTSAVTVAYYRPDSGTGPRRSGLRAQPATASHRLHTPSPSMSSAATFVIRRSGTRFIRALPPTMPSPATAHSASTAPRPTESGSS